MLRWARERHTPARQFIGLTELRDSGEVAFTRRSGTRRGGLLVFVTTRSRWWAFLSPSVGTLVTPATILALSWLRRAIVACFHRVQGIEWWQVAAHGRGDLSADADHGKLPDRSSTAAVLRREARRSVVHGFQLATLLRGILSGTTGAPRTQWPMEGWLPWTLPRIYFAMVRKRGGGLFQD